jgi:hypothetical protein
MAAKRKKPARKRSSSRRGLSGLGVVPADLRPLAPSELKDYEASRAAAVRQIGEDKCTLAYNSLSAASVALAMAVAKAAGKDTRRDFERGRRELWDDFDKASQTFMAKCVKGGAN